MPLISVDQETMLTELNKSLSLIPIENKEAREQVVHIMSIIKNSPSAENQSAYPRMRIQRI
jgi:hypothetical protein